MSFNQGWLPLIKQGLKNKFASLNNGKILSSQISPTTYVQSTIPSSPERGDIWIETDINKDIIGEWFWNGVYWIGRNILTHSFGSIGLPLLPLTLFNSSKILIERFLVGVASNNITSNDANNFVTYHLNKRATLSNVSIASVSSQALNSGNPITISTHVGVVFSTTIDVGGTLMITATDTGSPSDLKTQSSASIIYRLVK